MIHSTLFCFINDEQIPDDPKPWKLGFYNNLITEYRSQHLRKSK